jgi:hypothetical protein
MTRRFRIAYCTAAALGFLCAGICAALAQQSPLDDMQGARNQFMVMFGQCDSAGIAMRQEIAKLKAEIDALKAPKTDAPKAEPPAAQ